MAEKRFEQQAKELLENFELSPTPVAWEKIRNEIQPEEHKRRFAFWWLLPVLLIGGGAIYFASTYKSENGSVAEQKTSRTTSENNNTSQKNEPSQTTNPDQQLNVEGHEPDKVEQNIERTSISVVNSRSNKLKKASTIIKATDDDLNSAPKEIPTQITIANDDKASVIENQASSTTSPANEADNGSIIKPEEQSSTEIAQTSEPKTSPAINSSAENAIPVVTVKEKKKTKWQFGITVEGGISSKAGKLSSAKSFGAVPNSLPTTGGFSSNSNIRATSNYTAGAMAGIGVAAQKQLSKLISFNAALGYQFQSFNERQTGYRDTVINNIYISNELYTSTNDVKLHALNAYAGLSFKLIGNSAVSLKAATGLDNLFLVSAKENSSVQIRTATSSVTDKSLNSSLNGFNKWQPHLRAGLTLELPQKKNVIQFSPFIRYSLKDLEKTNSGKSRLFSAGLSATYFFNR